MNLASAVCYSAASLLVSLGAAWFSPGAGMVVGGACVAALTTLAVLEVPDEAD